MVRIPFFGLCLAVCLSFAGLSADEMPSPISPSDKTTALQTSLLNVLGSYSYNRNRIFINKLFADGDSFYQNGALDIPKILQTLQDNGLLRLRFAKPEALEITLSAQTTPIFLLRAVSKAMSLMGYAYWTPSETTFADDTTTLKITLQTEHIIDPIALLNELGKSGFVALNIVRHSDTRWDYALGLYNPKMPDAKPIAKGNAIVSSEVSGEYWLTLGSPIGILEIGTMNGKRFSAQVVFFDKNLNLLEILDFERANLVKADISANARFVLIKDRDNAANLKGGISVIFR